MRLPTLEPYVADGLFFARDYTTPDCYRMYRVTRVHRKVGSGELAWVEGRDLCGHLLAVPVRHAIDLSIQSEMTLRDAAILAASHRKERAG